MTESQQRDRASEIIDNKTRSHDWLSTNFYGEWEQVWKAYVCERDPEKDQYGKDDPTQTSIGMPDTWAMVRRSVARITAQIPNLRFHAKDRDISELISRTLMYQWDRGGVQRIEKKNVTQEALFGWTVRPWFWSVEEYTRRKRIDLMAPGAEPAAIKSIVDRYGPELAELSGQPDPQAALADPVVRAKLLVRHGRGKLLPVEYTYCAYRGPRCDFLFVGDCYPEPNFQSVQSSKWFITERRRDKEWLENVARAFDGVFAKGIAELLKKHPKGSPPKQFGNRDTTDLRRRLLSVLSRQTDETREPREGTQEWTITEQHVPGRNATLTLVAEDDIWLGEIPYPYDLDGKIAFTESVLIDDLLCGIGLSTPRVLRGLQELHDRQVNRRVDLVDTILRPLVGTTNRQLYDNPDLLKRGKGMRLVLMRGPGEMWMQTEQAATAAVVSSLQDESAIMRMMQMATGDSNMSMAANVDPSQNRTATGARIMAYNQDVLTKDLIDMHGLSVKSDVEMMYLLNRSELTEPIEFEAGRYNRSYAATKDELQDKWVAATPAMFQTDGEITAEVGSTMADDDESKVSKAQTLWTMGNGNPFWKQDVLRDEMLIAMGHGKDLEKFASAPPPPPPPELRTAMSVSFRAEMLPPEVQALLLKNMTGGQVAENQPGLQQATPPTGGSGEPAAAPEVDAGVGAYAASKGRSPVEMPI